MPRKDHLVTIQEEDKSSKKAFKRNNAILYQAIQPTIANEINGIGATSKTPDQVKDTKFPILNPIDPIGKNTDGTVNVDLSLENSPFTCIELSDVGATISAIVINLINLVKNFAEKFILDITKDPANVSLPTVTFVPTVENLPAGFPDNDPRYLLEIVARETPTETRFEVVNTGAGGSGNVPAGTVENEHLEWDNVATDWVAVQASTYGATGPFAGTGFLRFANDNIMLSQRNAGDSSDLQFKVSTLDEFDFTNSLDSSVVDLVIRAQQSPQPNAKFVIRQNPDDGASGDITTFTAPQSILFNVNASIMFTIGPTEIDVQVNLDMNDGNVLNITELQGRDDATPFKIVFDQAEDADTFISDDTTTADRINVTAGGNTFFSWIAGTPNIFGVPSGQTAELEMSTNDIKSVDRLTWSATGNTGSPASITDGVIYRDATGGMVFNNNVLDTFFWTLSDVTRAGLNALTSNQTDFFIRSDSTDFNSLPIFSIQRDNQSPVAPAQIGTVQWLGNDNLNNARVYADITADYEDVLNTQIAGSLIFNVAESVSLVQYMTMNDAKDNVVKILKPLNMDTNAISQIAQLALNTGGGLIQGVALGIDFVNTATRFRFIQGGTDIVDITASGIEMQGSRSIIMGNNNITGINQLTFNQSGQNIADSLDGIIYSSTDVNEYHSFVLNGGERFRIEDGFIDFFTSFYDMTEVASPADPPANQGRFFTKDVSGDTHPFFVNSTETEFDLTSGGGVSFPITPTVDVRGTVTVNQAVDISQADGHVTTMTLGAASITVTFSGFPATGTQQTWELHVSQDGTGGRTLVISPTPVESFTISNGVNTLTILTFLTNDGGTDIHVVPSLRGSISLSADFLPLSGGTMTGDIVMGTNSITGIDDLTFTDDATQPGNTVTFLAKTVTELNYNVPVNDLHNFRVAGTSEMTINATTIDFQGNSVIDGILGVTITGISGITGLGTQGQNLVMGNFNITGISDLLFTEVNTSITATTSGIVIAVPDTTDTINIDVNGRITQFADGFIDISTNSIDITERTAPAATANQAKLYSKDVSTVTHMFVIDSAGVETDLTVGGGNEFFDDLFRIKDNIDDSRKLAFQTGGIAGSTTRTWTVQNADGTVALLDGGVTQTFIDAVNFNGNLLLGNATTDTITINPDTINLANSQVIKSLTSGLELQISSNDSFKVVQGTSDDRILTFDRVFVSPDSVARLLIEHNVANVQRPVFLVMKNAANGAANHAIGQILWDQNNASGNLKDFANQQVDILDATNAAEEASWFMQVMANGSLTNVIQGDGLSGGGIGLAFRGVSPQAVQNYTITNPTTDRTLDVAAELLDGVRETLGTLIQDLIDMGLLS